MTIVRDKRLGTINGNIIQTQTSTRGTAGHPGKGDVHLVSTKGPKCSEHCGHDLVGAVSTSNDGLPNAHKVKGKAVDPEVPRVDKDTLGYAGTVYICRVIYGEFLVANVYFYHLLSKNSVTTYNGTTENHVDTKKNSTVKGAEPKSEIDIEASA